MAPGGSDGGGIAPVADDAANGDETVVPAPPVTGRIWTNDIGRKKLLIIADLVYTFVFFFFKNHVFRCAVASLQEGVSVRPCVRPSVCPSVR